MEQLRVHKVFNPINALSVQKSDRHDNIPPYFVKVASNVIAPLLCYSFDDAFVLGIFPQSCKIA